MEFYKRLNLVCWDVAASDFDGRMKEAITHQMAELAGLPSDRIRIVNVEAGSVVVTLSLVGFHDTSTADAVAALLLTNPPPTGSFGRCVVVRAATVTSSKPPSDHFQYRPQPGSAPSALLYLWLEGTCG